MPFKCLPIPEQRFTSFDELMSTLDAEARNTSRLPLSGLLAQGAEFLEDNGFGVVGSRFLFNEAGFDAFTRTIGVPGHFVQSLHEDGLATDVRARKPREVPKTGNRKNTA